MYKVLVINPGSTSTKIAVFNGKEEICGKTIRHSAEELVPYKTITDQYDFRKDKILEMLKEANIDLSSLDAIVGRGGLLKPIPGGTYKVTSDMIDDLRIGILGEHASNLGGILANEIAKEAGNIPAFIVDPVVVDEMSDLAKFSGRPEIWRKSIFHALNQKAVARRYAIEKGKKYEDINLIVAHLGGGFSIGAHEKGKVVDVNNALNGDGPFSPERAGGLPAWDLIEIALSNKYTRSELKKFLAGKGGVVAYLGVNDMLKVQKEVESGNKEYEKVYKAMAYQVAKEIGACAAVLKGDVDAIILTGGIAYDSQLFVPWIKERVSFIAEIIVYPGEDEMKALYEGAVRVLSGEEEAKVYQK